MLFYNSIKTMFGTRFDSLQWSGLADQPAPLNLTRYRNRGTHRLIEEALMENIRADKRVSYHHSFGAAMRATTEAQRLELRSTIKSNAMFFLYDGTVSVVPLDLHSALTLMGGPDCQLALDGQIDRVEIYGENHIGAELKHTVSTIRAARGILTRELSNVTEKFTDAQTCYQVLSKLGSMKSYVRIVLKDGTVQDHTLLGFMVNSKYTRRCFAKMVACQATLAN